MSKKKNNSSFKCIVCNRVVIALDNGSFRNHCPFCLASLHVDNTPGDRENACKGIMLAKAVIFNSKKGWQIIHVCQKCKKRVRNKIANDCSQPDDWNLIVSLIDPLFEKELY